MIFCVWIDIGLLLTCIGLDQSQIPIFSSKLLNVEVFLIILLQSFSQKFAVKVKPSFFKFV